MNVLRQVRHLLTLLLGLHRQRPRDGILMSAGFMISAAALAVMLAIPAGIERIAGRTGQDDIAIVISDGAMAREDTGALTPEQVAVVSNLPQVARDADGRALVAPQVLVNAKLAQADGTTSSILLRGVTPAIWEVLDRQSSPPTGRAAAVIGQPHFGTTVSRIESATGVHPAATVGYCRHTGCDG